MDRFADSVRVRMSDNRRIDNPDGTSFYRGSTFERRLAIVIEISDRLGSYEFAALASPLFERLLKEWETEHPEIVDFAEFLRVLEDTQHIPPSQIKEMREVVQESILDAAKTGCGSGDLRELIMLICTEN